MAVLLVNITSKKVYTVLVQVYMPTSGHTGKDIGKTYNDIDELIK